MRRLLHPRVLYIGLVLSLVFALLTSVSVNLHQWQVIRELASPSPAPIVSPAARRCQDSPTLKYLTVTRSASAEDRLLRTTPLAGSAYGAPLDAGTQVCLVQQTTVDNVVWQFVVVASGPEANRQAYLKATSLCYTTGTICG
jgi:hypothetical protein